MRSWSAARSTRRVAALGLAALTAVSLTACADGASPAADPAPGVAQPASLVTQANFAELISMAQADLTSMRMEVSLAGAAFDQLGGSTTATVADVDLTAGSPAMSMTTTVMGQDVEMIVVDGTSYLSLGALTGGGFVSLTAEDLLTHSGIGSLTTLADQFETDLGAQAKELAAGITSFEQTGTDTIDGEPVTVFTLTVDPARIGAAAGAPVDAAPHAIPNELVVTYALDSNNVPRRIDLAMDVEGEVVTVSTTITRINEPVTITAPPADQVTPFSALGL